MATKKETERLIVMESEVKHIKEVQDTFKTENRSDHKLIFTKIDSFIKTANDTYATKKEVDDVKKDIKTSRGFIKENIGYVISGATLVILLWSVLG